MKEEYDEIKWNEWVKLQYLVTIIYSDYWRHFTEERRYDLSLSNHNIPFATRSTSRIRRKDKVYLIQF